MGCDFKKTIKILLGPGRAWLAPDGGTVDKIFTALSKEPAVICNYANTVRDIGIPGRIPDEGLDYWESDLALKKDTSMTNAERNQRIVAKLTAVGGQGSDYIERVIQSAGFDMYITENNPISNPDVRNYTSTLGGVTLGSGATLGGYTDRIDPRTVTGELIAGPNIIESIRNYSATLGGVTLGAQNLGQYTSTQTIEYEYVIPAVPGRYIFVWFLHGPLGLNDFVDMSENMWLELRRIILEIKPAHTWCVAQVNIV